MGVANRDPACASSNRIRPTFAFLITFAFFGCFGWLFFGDAIQEYVRRQQFDSNLWQGQKSFDNDVRIRMVDDLLSRHDFRGMSLERLTAILGEPDKTDYFEDWDLVYWLGPERGWMSIDSEWLVFRFDSENKVSEYRIVRD